MPLPNDLKYIVATALLRLTNNDMVSTLQAMDVDMARMDVTRIDRLDFTVRITPTDSGAPRYINVRVSEPV